MMKQKTQNKQNIDKARKNIETIKLKINSSSSTSASTTVTSIFAPNTMVSAGNTVNTATTFNQPTNNNNTPANTLKIPSGSFNNIQKSMAGPNARFSSTISASPVINKPRTNLSITTATITSTLDKSEKDFASDSFLENPDEYEQYVLNAYDKLDKFKNQRGLPDTGGYYGENRRYGGQGRRANTFTDDDLGGFDNFGGAPPRHQNIMVSF